MKNTVLFIVMAFAAAIVFGQANRSEMNLKGDVKSIYVTSNALKSTPEGFVKDEKGWEYNWYQDSKSEFDLDGNLVKKTCYSVDSEISNTEYNTYTNGLIIKTKTKGFIKNFEYDENGLLITEKLNSCSKTDESNEHVILLTIFSYYYDSNNRLIEKKVADSAGVLLGSYIFQYNEKDLLVKSVYYVYGDGGYSTFTYDSLNNLVLKFDYNVEDQLIKKHIYKYDGKDCIYSETQFFFLDQITGSVVNIYVNGDIVQIIGKDAHGETTNAREYKYKYDQFGNWTEKIIIIEGVEKYIEQRIIEYY